MDTAMSKEQLKKVLDQVTREVTERSVGIRLVQRDSEPGGDLCTVHIGFQKGFRSSLSLRANTAMLTRLTQSMLQEEHITAQDLEDVSKEFFNVLCGHIAAALFQATQTASRFSVPAFYRGAFSPQDGQEQFTLNYFSGENEAAQLVHHVPAPQKGAGARPDYIKSSERGIERNDETSNGG